MNLTLVAVGIGGVLDALWGDPLSRAHPVVWIGKLIAALEQLVRRVFPDTPAGQKLGGGGLWLMVVLVSTALPAGILWLCRMVSPWLALVVESVMCWQVLALKCLCQEATRVERALTEEPLEGAQRAVARIVGRETHRLDAAGVTRAAVETVAENVSDGVIAPLIFLVLGGAPLGFCYKAINTMDSMLGYVDPPYRDIGLVPARMDDLANWIPSRFSALMMLAAGAMLGMDFRRGWKIFRRDRFCHASPNSAQTESACAGLLGVQLGGSAWYHGVRHEKPVIGDALRAIEPGDISRTCCLAKAASLLALVVLVLMRLGWNLLRGGGGVVI